MKASLIVPIRVDHLVFAFYIDYLALCLEALAKQDIWHPDTAEIILVDYGSVQPYQEQIETLGAHHRATIVRAEDAVWSRGRAMNTGAAVATGDLLLFVDADVICPPNYVRAHMDEHRMRGSLVLSSRVFHLAQGTARSSDWATVSRQPGKPCPGGWSHFSVRAVHFATVGGFDPAYYGWGGEDDDLLLRLKQIGLKWEVGGPIPCHLWHDGFVSLSLKAGRPELAATPKKNHDRYYARKDGKL